MLISRIGATSHIKAVGILSRSVPRPQFIRRITLRTRVWSGALTEERRELTSVGSGAVAVFWAWASALPGLIIKRVSPAPNGLRSAISFSLRYWRRLLPRLRLYGAGVSTS